MKSILYISIDIRYGPYIDTTYSVVINNLFTYWQNYEDAQVLRHLTIFYQSFSRIRLLECFIYSKIPFYIIVDVSSTEEYNGEVRL